MFTSRPSKTVISGGIFAVLLAAGAALPSSYMVQRPGPVLDVTEHGENLVTVGGTQTFDSGTHFLMTTVNALGNADAGISGAVVASALLTSDEVVPVRAYYPKEVSSSEVNEQNVQLMTSSQDTAAAVAFEEAGMDVSMTLSVAGVPEGSPAEAILQEGDVLRAITTPERTATIGTFRQMTNVLDDTAPGTQVTLTIERDGSEQEVTTTTRGFEPDVTGWVHPGSVLGIYVSVTDVQLPAQATYAVEGIGGPSAGTMFTLAIYDAVTPGSLGGDAVIAGTGAIAWDGDIEPIGGIRHKLAGASAAGATDFIAPAYNCPETIGYELDGLNIWAVRTIDQAIAAVEAIGAGDTSSLTPCSALPEVNPEG
ncbi:S16 family serine protease [Trueperella bernardiae]|uniref:endopeptidase La n=1 Tax=Trueperella bernardiae TaxID=59561 RepID=A0AAW6ZG19_9ACTO|nr:S16 family serine protease [Trueperella bernardiae]MDK8602200.1 S16 family serine protease [Trueperella bernardiae]